MYCPKCNHKNPENSTFCEKCGNILTGKKQKKDINLPHISFCPSCGSELETGAEFCAVCGTATDNICEHCGSLTEAGTLFCPDCGTPVPARCPVCKKKNTAGAIHCEHCGSPMYKKTPAVARIAKHPAFIAAASIIIFLGIYFVWSNKTSNYEPEVVSTEETYQKPAESSSSSSSSDNSKSSLKDFARIEFNIANTLDNKPRLTIKCPQGVYFIYNGSDGGKVENPYRDISGKYSFTYSAITGFGQVKEKDRKTYKGSFYLDGKYSFYEIEINDWGFSVDVCVRGYHP